MPADVESAAFSNTPAWHGAGTVVQGFMSTEQAFRQSGLDWEGGVEKRPLWVPSRSFPANARPEDVLEASQALGGQPPGNILRDPIHVSGNWAVVRNKDNSVLGVVGPNYQVIQNIEMFNFLDALTTGEDRVAQWESAGSLRDGKHVWALLNLVETKILVGKADKVLPYILVTNAHDGSASCRVIPTTVRVVCWNTLSAAVAGTFSELTVTIRHVGDVPHKLEQAKLMLAKAGEMFGAFEKVANELSQTEVTKETLEEFIQEMFPSPEDDATDLMKKRTDNQRDLFGQSLREEKDAEIKLLPAAGENWTLNYWTLLNGATRYADHAREVRPGKRPVAEARMESNMMGSNKGWKERAAHNVFMLSGVGPGA